MIYEGDVYRPPSEADSLIIQLTIGCARNRCTFCTMYKDKVFRVRPIPEVLADLEEAARTIPYPIRKVFLADGDALIVKTSDLVTVLDRAFALFPSCRRVTVYGATADVLAKSHDELCTLRAHGLTMVYLGAETGSDRILAQIKKGITSAETIEACHRLKAAGIQTSMTLITGIGGVPQMEENAVESARLVTAAKPEYLGLLTLTMNPGTELTQDYLAGRFLALSPLQDLEEQKRFLEEVDSEGTVLRSNHISNYLALAGTLNGDRAAMIDLLAKSIANGHLRPKKYRGL